MKNILLAALLILTFYAHAETQNMICEFLESPTGSKFRQPEKPMSLSLERGLIKDKIIWNGKELDDTNYDKKNDYWSASSQNKNVIISFSNKQKILAIKNNSTDVQLNFLCATEGGADATKNAIFRPHMWMISKDYTGISCSENIKNSKSDAIEMIGFLPNPIPGRFISTLTIGKQNPKWISASSADKEEIEKFFYDVSSKGSLEAKYSFRGNVIDMKTRMFDEDVILSLNYDQSSDSVTITKISCVDNCKKTDIQYTAFAEKIRKLSGIKYQYCKNL
ncbi:hypothetical protein [Polynucleobacter sinensis]|uniref:hypothetical protein n=1 Tax=Polynucleobacter sinensis TaxID=1743157 RepID=UPI000781E603|nr:hypothetical protein [Polynucleobacter sinensis]